MHWLYSVLHPPSSAVPMAADCVAYMGAVLLPWIALCPLAWQMPFNFYAHRAVSSVGVACCTIWVAVTCWDSWDTLRFARVALGRTTFAQTESYVNANKF